jgi:serine/threonine-protein kinase RsbW
MIEITSDDNRTVVKPEGDIVASTVEGLRTALKETLGQGVSEVTLDLGKVSVIDSIGLGLVISVHNSLAKKGGKLTVTNVSKEVLELFKSMRLDRHFSVSGV